MGKYEKKEEVHLYLDLKEPNAVELETTVHGCIDNLKGKYGASKILHTTIPHFLSFDFGKRLYVHTGDSVHEIREGECEGTSKWIRHEHNIEKMLFAGTFDYYNNYENE